MTLLVSFGSVEETRRTGERIYTGGGNALE